ncbi:hypothetical protein Q8F55_009245 [Vanrija albida]|uniref:GDP/GTP exchange factor Sec2 N-terminal domain-containing protein n=1 Tax=Vanrija albida TaxID=181172 RepID=A0ABR3PT38_9TREE
MGYGGQSTNGGVHGGVLKHPPRNVLPNFPQTGNTVQDLVTAVDRLVVAVEEESKGRQAAEKQLAEVRKLHQQDQETAYACFEEERKRREDEEEKASIALVQERKGREEDVAKAAALLAEERQARLLAEARLADMQAKLRAFAGLGDDTPRGASRNGGGSLLSSGVGSINSGLGVGPVNGSGSHGVDPSLSPESSYAPTPAQQYAPSPEQQFGTLARDSLPARPNAAPREKRVSFGSGSRLTQ